MTAKKSHVKTGRPKGRPKGSTKKKTQATTIPPEQITPHPTNEAGVLNFEKRLDEILNEARPENLKAAAPTTGPVKETPELSDRILADAIKIPFELWSFQFIDDKLKANIRLSKSEADILAAPVNKLLAHYLPKIPDIAYAWFALTITTWSVMSVRLKLLAEYRKMKSVTPSEPGTGSPTVREPTKTAGQAPGFPSVIETNHV